MRNVDAKNIISSEVAIDNIKFKDINNNCITGETNHLLPKLRQAFKKAIKPSTTLKYPSTCIVLD